MLPLGWQHDFVLMRGRSCHECFIADPPAKPNPTTESETVVEVYLTVAPSAAPGRPADWTLQFTGWTADDASRAHAGVGRGLPGELVVCPALAVRCWT